MPFDVAQLGKFPTKPGVYIMKDKSGKVIYVGKAINLRARVKQYFQGHDDRPQIPFLIARVETIDTVVVGSEKEALLLENTLIKEHTPRYNVFLKDDKTYISLMITTKHEWPRIRLVRYKGKPKNDGLYFGPYTSTFAARQTLELLMRLFPLRRCSDRELKSRKRPCILYQIKKCVAPCVGKSTREEYDTIVTQVVKFLQGKDRQLLKELRQEMERAAQALEFEKADQLHQSVKYIERTIEQQHVDQAGTGDRDIFGLYREAGEVCLTQMLFRDGKLIGAQNHSFSNVVQTDADLFTSFLIQHYETQESGPHEVLLPCPIDGAELLSEVLSTDKKRKIVVKSPQRGKPLSLIEMANANAHAAFHREKDARSLREQRLLELEERCKLNNYPRRIECFDNSNLSGSEPVAAMCAFTDGEPDKKRYRKYKTTPLDQPDDYAAMREVLTRRLKRGKANDDLPDLIIVDGGKGQLNIAIAVLTELDIVTVDLIGLAKEKGRHDKGITAEQIFLPGAANAMHLGTHSHLLFLLQQIRDEAHRFAITYQKQRRSKKSIGSIMDNIPGVGPTLKTRLLTQFGSVKRIAAASNEELLAVSGVNVKIISAIRAAL